MVERLRAQAAQLARFPESERIVPEYNDPYLREVLVPPYRLIYRLQSGRDRVQIIAVVHSSRMLPPLPDEG